MSSLQGLTRIPKVKRDFMDYLEFLTSLKDLGFQFPYAQPIKVLRSVTLFKTEVTSNAPQCSLILCDSSTYGLMIKLGPNQFIKPLTSDRLLSEVEFHRFTFEYDGWITPDCIKQSLDAFKKFEQSNKGIV